MMKLILSILLSTSIGISCSKKTEDSVLNNSTANTTKVPVVDDRKTDLKAGEAQSFCKKNNFNTDFCILIDMSLHSGLNRFFIYDFNQKKVTQKYLVGHGCGKNSWSSDESKDHPTFSNEDGSHLSSLGKYRIGERGSSEWGINIKYLLHGLDETNGNALKRTVVFHSWNEMSDQEVFPKGSPEGWGCPTVSNNALKSIDPLLKGSSKPVLMWIYN